MLEFNWLVFFIYVIKIFNFQVKFFILILKILVVKDRNDQSYSRGSATQI